MYTTTVIDDKPHCMEIMSRMEAAFAAKDEEYFIKVLKEEASLVLRVHAVCILAEVGSGKSVPVLADVLFHDPDPLVRHEAAFSLGQIGVSAANDALGKAMLTDADPIVRHESAAALGSIGSPAAEIMLRKALADKDEIVRNSAETSLFNIEYLKHYSAGGTARDRAPRP